MQAIVDDSSLNPIEKARKKQALINARILASLDDDHDVEQVRTLFRTDLIRVAVSPS